MSLFEELVEYTKDDEKIVKSFETKDTLSNEIFDESKDGFKMKEGVRSRLLEIADDFVESFGVEFFIHDVVLTGSLANFNWSEFSDVDLHVLIDMGEIDGDNDSPILMTII